MPPVAELSPSPNNTSDDNDDDLVLDRARIKALNKALDGQGKVKQTSKVLQPYTSYARFHIRSENLYANWYTIIDKGFADMGGTYDALTEEQFKTKYAFEISTFNDMKQKIQCFNVDIPYFLKYVDRKDDLAKAMIAASSAARSEDIASLTSAILTYINEGNPDHKVIPEISAKLKKSESRGFKHVVLARLCCPARLVEKFDENPEEFMRKLDDGSIEVLATDMPNLLWPHDQYDPEDTDYMMFRNEVLLMVWKHIFTSPTSALKDGPGQTKTRSSQAKMHNMQTVTKGSLAYAAVMFRYVISAIEDWRIEEKLFKREKFYRHMLAMFDEDPMEGDAEWVKDTIEWYNAKVFGTDPHWADQPENLAPPSTLSIVKAQRRARKASKAAAEVKTANRAPTSSHVANPRGGDRNMPPPPVPATRERSAPAPPSSGRARSPRRRRSQSLSTRHCRSCSPSSSRNRNHSVSRSLHRHDSQSPTSQLGHRNASPARAPLPAPSHHHHVTHTRNQTPTPRHDRSRSQSPPRHATQDRVPNSMRSGTRSAAGNPATAPKAVADRRSVTVASHDVESEEDIYVTGRTPRPSSSSQTMRDSGSISPSLHTNTTGFMYRLPRAARKAKAGARVILSDDDNENRPPSPARSTTFVSSKSHAQSSPVLRTAFTDREPNGRQSFTPSPRGSR